ncbi:MAG: thymidylate kinase [archaeon]|jgi:dTMP kinase
MQGKLIVIEGTDGSGKATQSKLLIEALNKKNISTEYVDFPQYGEKSAGLVENYLNGKYGSASEVSPKVASIFYAVDRYDASFKIRPWLNDGKVVISNRYVSANLGHQTGKIKDQKERDEFVKWLEDLEYNLFGIPKPDLTILLFMPCEIAQKLVDNKAARAYIGGQKRDIHEADLQHLKDAEKAYLDLVDKKGWKLVECSENGSPLPIEKIQEKVLLVVEEFLKN